MSDPTRSQKQTGTLGAELQQAGGEAKAGAADLAAKARDAAGGVRDEATGLLQDVKAEGASVVEAAQDRAASFAEEQQRAGAEQADTFARAIHRAADELQGTSPQIARYVHEAASSLGDLGRALRERSPGDLIGGLEGLARRQPVAFFGAAVLAGFALARFAKSSAEDAAVRSGPARGAGPFYGAAPARAPFAGEAGGRAIGGGTATPHTTAAGAPGWVPDPGGAGAKPATMAAASLGGAAARPAAAAGRTGHDNQSS